MTKLQEIKDNINLIGNESILKEAEIFLSENPSFVTFVYWLWTFLTTRLPFMKKFVEASYSFCAIANIFMYENSFFDDFFSKIIMLFVISIPDRNEFLTLFKVIQILYYSWSFLISMCRSDYVIMRVCASIILLLTIIHQTACIQIYIKK